MKTPLKVALLLFAIVLSLLACSKDDEPQLSPAKFSIDQSTVDFGVVGALSGKKDIKLTITNTGEEDLILKDYILSGSNASDFSVNAGETEETVPAGETYEFIITFEPLEIGDKTAILTIISNVSEHKINLLGKAQMS
ncbi:choice-of-anchor D domain-containing protein [Tenacibaculum caenipelagi]|uniref:ASPM-SPD-2-Hydin domain-containing protein n=1 Tax=Tenacibaculum caenipelagi TaxID=1325435 RepID=A0A4R6TEB8_9FLAO|nr:choice-of-anchor D domain-containing protein [Tenacibaculum caenipelagi]TDQ24030.1 ASPM-SPD-2-Hydin domain-containing protein [Tenacibaculum caenipelagi]